MIKSMTGFGKGVSKGKFGRFIVEVRTVNHRYFDLTARLPHNLNQLEEKIKNYTHRYIKRGKVNFSLLHRKGEKPLDPIAIDYDAAEKYCKLLGKLKKKFKLKDDIKLSHLLSFPDVIIQEHPEHKFASMWPFIEKAVKKAISDCGKMKKKEGMAIYRDLSKRITKVSKSVGKIFYLVPELVCSYQARLDSTVKNILKSRNYEIDRKRLETEVAKFARQCDVSEEITRSKSHLAALKNALLSNGESGRRLDFILQELQREINTLGAKAGSAKISSLVVDIKSEIEKMREQAQNVE